MLFWWFDQQQQKRNRWWNILYTIFIKSTNLHRSINHFNRYPDDECIASKLNGSRENRDTISWFCFIFIFFFVVFGSDFSSVFIYFSILTKFGLCLLMQSTRSFFPSCLSHSHILRMNSPVEFNDGYSIV